MLRHAVLVSFALTAGVPLANAATQSSPEYLNVRPDAMLTSNLLGLEVYEKGDSQQALGKIADVVFDNNQLKGYVLGVGGFAGINERYVAVDPSMLQISYDASAKKWKAVANATPDQLKSAPEFKYESKWK